MQKYFSLINYFPSTQFFNTVMFPAEIFHGITSCVALLYGWNVYRHCEASEAISCSVRSVQFMFCQEIASFLEMTGKIPSVQECDARNAETKNRCWSPKKCIEWLFKRALIKCYTVTLNLYKH